MEKLAVQKLTREAEIKRLGMEECRLSVADAGVCHASVSVSGRSMTGFFDVLSNLHLVPQFCERDPDTFFSLFEHVAESREWPDSDCTLLSQCVLTGKAQEANSSLTVADSKDYATVKAAMCAYELVPEAYCQKFRTWQKADKQMHMEFARELVTHFSRWCAALKVVTYEALCDVVVLEQFK